MINNINDNSSTNTVTSTNSLKQETAITISVSVEIQSLLHVASNLELIKEALDDFKADDPEQAAEHEKELNQLYREIERLQKDIVELKALPEAAEAEKKPLMGRIKERWDNFAERAKQCYYVTGMAAKVTTAAHFIAGIDWNILPK